MHLIHVVFQEEEIKISYETEMIGFKKVYCVQIITPMDGKDIPAHFHVILDTSEINGEFSTALENPNNETARQFKNVIMHALRDAEN